MKQSSISLHCVLLSLILVQQEVKAQSNPGLFGETAADDAEDIQQLSTGGVIGAIVGSVAVFTLLTLYIVFMVRRNTDPTRESLQPDGKFIRTTPPPSEVEDEDSGSQENEENEHEIV